MPAGAAMTTITMITDIIMRMRCSQAGDRETIKTYTKEEIEEILKTLESDEALRRCSAGKGDGCMAGKDWIYFDMVPDEHEVRRCAGVYRATLCHRFEPG